MWSAQNAAKSFLLSPSLDSRRLDVFTFSSCLKAVFPNLKKKKEISMIHSYRSWSCQAYIPCFLSIARLA